MLLAACVANGALSDMVHIAARSTFQLAIYGHAHHCGKSKEIEMLPQRRRILWPGTMNGYRTGRIGQNSGRQAPCKILPV